MITAKMGKRKRSRTHGPLDCTRRRQSLLDPGPYSVLGDSPHPTRAERRDRDGRFLGGVGYLSEPQTSGFTFLIGSQEVLSFGVTLEPARWSSLDGQVEVAYFPTWKSNVDSGGFFYVTVPKDRVIDGKPLILGARSQGEGSMRWFAVDTFDDAKDHQGVLDGSVSK